MFTFVENAAALISSFDINEAITDERTALLQAEKILKPHTAKKNCLQEHCKNCRAAILFMDWMENFIFMHPSTHTKTAAGEALMKDQVNKWIEGGRYTYSGGNPRASAPSDPQPASLPAAPAAPPPAAADGPMNILDLIRLQTESEAAADAQRRLQRDQQRLQNARALQGDDQTRLAAMMPDSIPEVQPDNDRGSGGDPGDGAGEPVGAGGPSGSIPARGGARSGRGGGRGGRGGRTNTSGNKRAREKEPPPPVAQVQYSERSGRMVKPTEKAAALGNNIGGTAVAQQQQQTTQHDNQDERLDDVEVIE